MNVSYADKNNAAALGTAARTWSAANANEVKAAVNSKASVVEHGADPGVARPVGPPLVMWIGSVEPTNAAANDLYFPTA